MLDPNSLYELADDPPELERPVLVQALTGFVDAGNATRIARDHLTAGGHGRPIAIFDLDQLLDYRSRRPAMVFNRDRWDQYEEPRLTLSMLTDAADTPFLLLSGPEPDLQWERFIAAVIGLIDRFGVRLTVGLNAIPMAVPHTRPTGLTAHSTRRELIQGYDPWPQRVQVPGSVGNLMEYRLGQRGKDAVGFAAHVPHYLAQSEYPAAAERMVSSIAASTGLRLRLDDLRVAAELVGAEVDRQVAQAQEAAALVQALEKQYDAQLQQQSDAEAAEERDRPLPTADELAAELERFLAEQPKPGDSPPA
jgi:PAC2 family